MLLLSLPAAAQTPPSQDALRDALSAAQADPEPETLAVEVAPAEPPAAEVVELPPIPPVYVEEMKGFHSYCLQNSYLKKNHDCSCLAVKYLSQRQAVGPDATSADIIQAINHECIPESRITSFPIPEGKPIDFSELTEMQIEDGQAFYDWCDNNPGLKRTYECKCLAVNYVGQRLKRGYSEPRESILFSINSTCPNVVDTAGQVYTDCMNHGSLIPLGMNAETYCTCVGNKFGEIYGQLGRAYSSQNNVAMRKEAMISCTTMPGMPQ